MAVKALQPPYGSPSWFMAQAVRPFNEPEALVVDLTPALAKTMLDNNPDNRSVKYGKVLQYASDMASGRWTLNGEPIIVANDGSLNDGQHRCLAVVESNQTIKTILVFGVDRSARLTIDQGIARSAGDYLTMEGIHYGPKSAGIARFVLAYEESEQRTISTRAKFSNAVVYERVVGDPTLAASSAFALKYWSHYKHLFSSSIMGAAHNILSKVHKDDAETFLTQIAVGENIKRGDPAFAVRTTFLNEKRERAASLETIFTAWNKFRQNADLRRIQLAGRFPDLI